MARFGTDPASCCSRPAGTFLSLGAHFQDFDRRQRLAFEELEKRTAPGRDVPDLLFDAELAMAASVSPPPAIEKPGPVAMACARRSVPPAN